MKGQIVYRLTIALLLTRSTMLAQSSPFQPQPLILTESRPVAGACFGSALAIGDFNNDKTSDLAVSAPCALENRAERVFIFYGRQTLQRTPNLTLSTREAGIGFGFTLAAGDWNRDGRTDLAVGAPEASNSNSEDSEEPFWDGRVIIYHGAFNFGANSTTVRSPLPPDPDSLIGGRFGDSLASGDMDGDGTSDLIVGAWLLDTVVVLYGGNTIGSRRTILRGGIVGEQFGFAVAAGDINKDGFADILIGAPFGGSNGTGAVYVFLGGKSLSSRPNVTLPNPHPPANPEVTDPTFASSLAVADINGDGYADAIVGSPNTSEGDPTESRPGRVYIYFGGPTLNSAPDLILQEPDPQATSAFGYALAVGDLNGDGTADLAVSAIGATVGNRQRAGRVYLFYGGPAIGPNPNFILESPSPEAGAEFGTAMAIGDLNRDGKPDLAVGAPGASRRAGQVFLYLGR